MTIFGLSVFLHLYKIVRMDHYASIQKVIEHIVRNKLHDRSLAQIAAHMGISERRLERLFTQWAGVSPTQFGRYLSLQYAKEIIEHENTLQTAVRTGLSSAGRLHDLFIDIEAVTPGEYKSGGVGLHITYSFLQSLFGLCLIGSTRRGVCAVLFCDSEAEGLRDLRDRFPEATLEHATAALHAPVAEYLSGQIPTKKMRLHLRGTNFQVKVWEALLTIPEGKLRTYGTLAKSLGNPRSARAVGSAVGGNPIGYIIPCHRVLKATGEVGGYHWGADRKRTMLAYEALRKNV